MFEALHVGLSYSRVAALGIFVGLAGANDWGHARRLVCDDLSRGASACGAPLDERAPPPEGVLRLGERSDPRHTAPDDPIWGEFWVQIDRPDRENDFARAVLAWADVRPGMVVADVGAGGGFYAQRFARASQPLGMVWAVDVDERMVRALSWLRTSRGLDNLVPVHVPYGSFGLPARTFDLVTLIEVGAFLTCESHRANSYVQQVADALRPGGRWLVGNSLDAAPRGHAREVCRNLTPAEIVALSAPAFRFVREQRIQQPGGWSGYLLLLERRPR